VSLAFGAIPNKKIAVIGAGISGLGAAYALSACHHVTLIEAEPRLGGHARTIMAGKNGNQPVDTGFIVYNLQNYPNVSRLFRELDVPVVESTMSFGVSIDNGRLEYALNSIDSLFAQRKNLFTFHFLRMVRDILRFNARALAMVDRQMQMTIGELLIVLRSGAWFRDYYLLPLSGAIWSTPTHDILNFPARTMVQFLHNHGLLRYYGQHQWYTIQGGSIEYVRRMEAVMVERGVEIRLGLPVRAVQRSLGSAQVKCAGGDWEPFDAVVFATHSDDALRLLIDPSADEKRALGAIRFQRNDIVVHADASVMPKRRKTWASWIYSPESSAVTDRIGLTYWMNSLQPIPRDDPHFVTLNSERRISEKLIYDQAAFSHPVFTLEAVSAQNAIQSFNGRNATWYCGAWMRHGFHEDGLASALSVVESLNRSARRPAVPE